MKPFLFTQKKMIQLAMFMLLISSSMKAQLVNIPDSKLKVILQGQLPYCFFDEGALLDTTCTNLLNVTTLDLSNSDIVNLEGIQYFRNLQSLNISANLITKLPSNLPISLKILNAKDNKLTELPSLPTSLTTLDVSDNFICSLPSSLPSGSITANNNFCVDFTYQAKCGENEVKFNAITAQKQNYSYSWDFGDNSSIATEDTPTHIYASAGEFNIKLTLTNIVTREGGEGSFNVSKIIEVSKKVNLSSSIKLAIASNLSLCASSKLLDAGPGFKTYLWQDGSTGQTFEATKPGTYTIMVTDEKGCSASQQIVLKFCEGFDKLTEKLKVPNVFTPNEDGKNDAFIIQNLADFPENKLEIYNRWGVLVYEASSYQNNWDAKEVGSGMYFYQLTVSAPDLPAKMISGWVQALGEK